MIRLVYVTTPDVDSAKKIGRSLVEDRLAACVNILPQMQSIYRWDEKIEEAHEAILIVKTTAERVPEVMARVKALHSYEVPCALSVPVLAGNPEYLSWLATAADGAGAGKSP